MSLFDIFKKKESDVKPQEAPQSRELTDVERNREASVASAQQIIVAIDALLFSMREPKKYPELTEENIASLVERFGNVQKVLGGTHCDCNVAELDGRILSLIQGLENNINHLPMKSWDEVMARLNDAVRARLKGEYEIRVAALDMAELYLQHTDATWTRQVQELQAAREKTTNPIEQLELDEMIIGTRRNILMNVKRREEIRTMSLRLQNDRVSPSEGTIRDIDKLLSSIKTETPEYVKIANLNAEAIRQKEIESKVALTSMREANDRLRDAMEAAELSAQMYGARLDEAVEQAAEPRKEREAVTE